MEPIRTHDGLFKFVFGEPEQMAELLRGCLPARVARRIDWSTLTRVPGAFVDRALRGREADLLFTVRMGQRTVLLYVVVEHKSANDRFAAWQIACYVVRILEQWRRENPDAHALPAVLPLVVHHGSTPWRSPRSPRDLVDLGGCDREQTAFLLRRQLHLPYLLLDLAREGAQRIEAMRMSAVSSLTLRFLQLLRECEPIAAGELIRSWAPGIGVLATHPRGHEVLFALLSWYIAGHRADRQTLQAVMNQIREIREEHPPMRSCLDLLLELNEERGLEKGLEKGRADGLRALLAAQLRARFGALPAAVEARLDRADAVTLERWGLRLLSAGSAEEVVAEG